MIEKNPLIKKKRQEVKKKRKKKRSRGPNLLFFLVLICFLTLIPLGHQLFLLGRSWDYLKIKQIEIKGNSRITSEQIRTWTGIEEGVNMLNFDLASYNGLAEAKPWIRSFMIERRFPNTVEIEVEERLPFLIWEDEGDYFLMDEFGILIDNMDEDASFEDLPIFTGFKTGPSIVGHRCPSHYWSDAISLVESINDVYPELMEDLIKIYISSEDKVTLILKEGRKIFLGIQGVKNKLTLLKGLLHRLPDMWQSIGYCDLRFSGKIIFG